MFSKNIFKVENDDMHPYVGRGDIVIYEPMQLGFRVVSDVYIIEYNGTRRVARVQMLVKGGMSLIFDRDKGKTKNFKEYEMNRVIFIGHVIARIFKNGERVEGYSFYPKPSTL